MSSLGIDSTVIMNDGVEIPVFGLGVYLNNSGHQTVDTIKFAIKNGYRHIDTAEFYGNEADVGKAMASSGVPRSELFVTSKLWTTDGRAISAKKICKDALKRANLDYFDLYLIHAPQGGHVKECYEALHDLKKDGLIRSVGVSNFGVHHLEAMERHGLPKPSNNQIELHPWQQKPDIVKYCSQNKIVLTSYSPLTKGQRLNDSTVSKVASTLGKTNAQVLIRWALEKNFVVIPKSSNQERIIENSQVFDWSIPPEQMEVLDNLGRCPWSCTWDPTMNSLKEAGL